MAFCGSQAGRAACRQFGRKKEKKKRGRSSILFYLKTPSLKTTAAKVQGACSLGSIKNAIAQTEPQGASPLGFSPQKCDSSVRSWTTRQHPIYYHKTTARLDPSRTPCQLGIFLTR